MHFIAHADSSRLIGPAEKIFDNGIILLLEQFDQFTFRIHADSLLPPTSTIGNGHELLIGGGRMRETAPIMTLRLS